MPDEEEHRIEKEHINKKSKKDSKCNVQRIISMCWGSSEYITPENESRNKIYQ
jgi:hypothetical protein